MVGNPASSNGWLVDIGGDKTSGPYSAEQIQEFIQAGKLLSHHRITAPHLGGQWITVAQFSAPAVSNAPFQPPPKPADLDSSGASHILRPGVDPTLGLFDALQAAKDRKAVHKPVYNGPSDENFFNRIPALVWLAGGATLAVGMIGWGLIASFKQQGEKLAQFETPPPASAAKSAKVAPAPVVAAPKTQIAAAVPLKPAAPATVPAFRPAQLSPGGATRPSFAISPFGKMPQGARPLVAPVVRAPAGDSRELDPYEQERIQREKEEDRERERAASGREPDSAISGAVTAPAPEGVTPPPAAKEASPKDDGGDRRDLDSSRID